MKHYYKFLEYKDGKIVSAHGDQEWEIGKEYSVSGKVEACENGFHASETIVQALSYVNGNVLAVVTASGDSDNRYDKVYYRSITIKRAYHWRLEDSIALAIYAAEQVVGIFEDEYPNDPRPRDAIKAAKAYLRCIHNGTEVSAYAATNAERAAYNSARAATYARAADSAYAAIAAAYAACAVDAARDACADNAARAARAAADAARAVNDEIKSAIDRWCLSRIKKLERI